MKHKTTPLGSIATITSGGTPDRKNAAYWNGDIPWVKTAQIQNKAITAADIDEWITAEGLSESSARMIPRGTILMAMYGQGKTRGQVAILDIDATINQACAAILLKDGVERDYVFQQLRYRYDAIRALSNTGSQENLNADLIREITFPLPPLDEQRKIACLLKDWDTIIDTTEHLIDAKERRYAGLIDQLIIRQARRDKTWSHKHIKGIADRVQRQSDGGDYPLLTISSASGFVRQEEKYSRYMAGESAKTYTVLKRGEFAYNKGNSLRYEFGCVFQLLDYDAALVPSVYVSFRLHDSVSDAYMRHLFAADYLKPQLRALVKTGVRNNGLLNIRPDEFMSATVPVPPLAEQERIATVLDEAREEIRLLTALLKNQRLQKRGLMQKLLTGEWHVPATEVEVA